MGNASNKFGDRWATATEYDQWCVMNIGIEEL